MARGVAELQSYKVTKGQSYRGAEGPGTREQGVDGAGFGGFGTCLGG
jgi:hypothetical protein